MKAFRAAGPVWHVILSVFRTPAMTMPWGRVYVARHAVGLPYWREIVAHERAHLEQIARDGAVWFSIRYLWGLARYGYWQMPYEIEARRIAEEAAGTE